MKEEKERNEKEKKEAEERHRKVQENIKKLAEENLKKIKMENEQKIKLGIEKGIEDYKKQNESKINLDLTGIEDKQLKENIEMLNQQSQLFKNKLNEVKQQCYEEMNQKYSKILQEKIKEIHKTILQDVQKQNQKILDNYVKQFEELERKRENDYNEMSQVMMSNVEKKDEIIISKIQVTHHGIKCNKCNQNPIIGYRYKCSICKDYNLCSQCEEINSETQEHPHNFIKMRAEEKKEEKMPKKEIFIDINNIDEEEKIEYKYELLTKELNKEVNEGQGEVIFDVILKNNFNIEWPGNGRTKLINDPNSDLKINDIILNNEQHNQNSEQKIHINLDGIGPGDKKCILHFNVDGQNYGEPIILNIKIKEDLIRKFRDQFGLSDYDYDDKKISEALKKNGGDFNKSFESFFN